MTHAEKQTLALMINKSVQSLKKLRLTYGGNPTSFASAMYAHHLRDAIDHELHEFLDVRVELMLDKINEKINHLESIKEKIVNL